jgi:tetratricopeptide (TPR) repeat protein
MMRLTRQVVGGVIVIAAILFAVGTDADPRCEGPPPVCDAAARVFVISSFDPIASAVLIEPGLLVTNRHVVADHEEAEVRLTGGRRIVAKVVPTAYPGDLILLKVEGLDGALSVLAEATKDQDLYTIGADIGRDAVRVYRPGRAILLPAADKPLARIHHGAPSQPGNSGGALVDAQGRLVGIVASGGEGRNEAIPVRELARLKALSGPEYDAISKARGLAYRRCAESLERHRSSAAQPDPGALSRMADICTATENRQLMDLAGQILGRARRFDDSRAIFLKSLEQDPNALNAKIALVVTLHLARRYTDELPYLRALIDDLPMDLEVLRLAVHAGKFGGDRALAERALALLHRHHPNVAPAAKRFLEGAPGGAAPPGR